MTRAVRPAGPATAVRRRGAAALRALAAAALLASAAPALSAQDYAGPLVPLGSRLDRFVSWAIADGALTGVDPLARPYRLAAVRRAVALQDTLALAPSGRRAFEWLREALAAFDAPTLVVAEGAYEAYRNARRDTFRPGGGRGAYPAFGVWVSMAAGPFTAVLSPALEGRLWDDPEYTGVKDKRVVGRMQTAYVAVSGARGDLVLGRMARDWGPGLFGGLVLSPSAYAYDALSGALRIGRFELSALAQQLDAGPDTAGAPGVPFNRFLFAHRLGIDLGRGVWLALYETGVYGGPGAGFRPAFHNPLNLGLLSELNDGLGVNVLVGGDLSARLSDRVLVGASGFIDDIQIDRTTLRDRRPTSYGFTTLGRYSLPKAPVHLALGYTRVASLSYRNEKDVRFVYALRGVGIGRNFADYDQWLLRAEARPAPAWYVAADLSWLRQGAGDFRLPFPSDSILALPGQGFLVAPAHTARAARVTVGAEPRAGLELRGEFGITQRLGGGTLAIASASAHVRLDLIARALGGAAFGIEPGADRAWP